MANKVIQQLISIRGLKIECPRCATEFPVKKAKLFSMYDEDYPAAAQKVIDVRLERMSELMNDLNERQFQLEENEKRKPLRIATGAKASNFGNICEQIIPALVTFPYKQNECRTLFRPVDYVVFAGLCEKAFVERIKFVDVKTGRGRLTKKQKQIRDRVRDGKIKHKVID